MVAEWYFLVSLLTGTFDPSTEMGWAKVQHYDFSAPSPEACEVLRAGTIQEFRSRLKGGEGLVVTGCQARGPR